jgi:hypothetical protein
MLKTLPEVRPSSVEYIDRSSDFAWLAANRENYVGKWVALFAGELVSAGESAQEVLEYSRRKGIERPLLVHVQDDLPFSGGWM